MSNFGSLGVRHIVWGRNVRYDLPQRTHIETISRIAGQNKWQGRVMTSIFHPDPVPMKYVKIEFLFLIRIRLYFYKACVVSLSFDISPVKIEFALSLFSQIYNFV